jgi:lysozyme
MIDNLEDQLIRDEGGFRLSAYKDSLGIWTIGCGHKLDWPSDKPCQIIWTLDQCKAQLGADMRSKWMELHQACPWIDELDVPRRCALVNMAFNLGVKGLLGFKNTLSLVESGKYKEASEEMLKSKWATQVGDRAKRLSKQMELGQWI